MANASDRYGSSLLALNTVRPPDPDRGEGIVHLDLTLPRVVAAPIALWENGARGPVYPREAAGLLWSVPVATYLTGPADAWEKIPGVAELLPALKALATLDAASWPTDQAALRAFVASKAPDSPTWNALNKSLIVKDSTSLLNDLVLIFKYAALFQRRSVRTAADLYRLVRTFQAPHGPTNAAEVVAWLTAPLVIPGVFAAPLDQSGPRAPLRPAGQPPTPPTPQFDLSTAAATRVLGRLDTELAGSERSDDVSRISALLTDAGIRDATVARRVANAIGDAVAPTSGATAAVEARVSVPSRLPPRIVNVQLFGAPVMIDIAEMQARKKQVRAHLAEGLLASLPARTRDRLVTTGVVLEDLSIWPDLLAATAASPSYLQPVGRNDLLLVRQTTIGYRRAEIAYVENVLVGENRSREHTQRTLSRQEFIEQVQRETEESRDLQVTDKAELSREVSNVVQENLRAEGSVQVTSRGPTQVVASASASYGRSTEEAAKTAETYARETIERAVKRSLERMTRETRSLFEQETTEVNRHGFERKPDATSHVSGVYQYLERVSRAKIFWYGERELYDLLIPEPAALIWQFAISRKEIQIPVESPDADLFASLTLANMAAKREDVIRAFRVTDMPPLPDEHKQLSVSFSATGGGDDAKYATSKELQIPDGYVVDAATFVLSAEVEDEDDTPNGGVTVAGNVETWSMPLSGNQGSARKDFTFAPGLTGPTVSVALNADNYTSLAGSVTLSLSLSPAAREQWALVAYGRVAERFEQLRREYAAAVIQASASQPREAVSLPEGSRLWLQQIVRSELQRSAIDVMRNAPVDYDLIADYPYTNADGSLGTQPVSNFDALGQRQPEIRFLQQAFEWEHLAWVLYPYFWGRRSEWARTVVTAHPDPDFTAFLNAGAARLQVPVRPGFECLVKHFMETGEVYEGEGLPRMGDPGYVSFIDEQLTTLGAPGDEVPWPPAAPREWDIIAPTPLLLVRSLAEPALPTWNPDTGDEA
jgi:hypothetical protein